MNVSQHPLDDKLLLGRYRVIRLLGEGGMGTVHLARVEGAEGFTRPVVVKRMRREIRSSDEGNRLFIREAKILSRLQHPAIAGISDFGIEDNAHIMVLEYVHGYPLSVWLEYRKLIQQPLPVDVCLLIVRRTLDALHYAHHFDTEDGQAVEIVHRDVSPDNVLLSNRGFVHLLDFGVANIRGSRAEKSTESGAFRGKLSYGAPETIQGHPATPRSDQYSSAVVLYEALTFECLFTAESMGETIVRMVNQLPAPAASLREGVAPGLDQALARALSKDPAQRFESCAAFSRALRPFQQRDDDEVAQELQELVRADFQTLPRELGIEALESRQDALAQVRAAAGAPLELKGNAGTLLGLAAHRLDAPAAEQAAPAAELAVAPAPLQRQLRGLLWGLLIVAGLIALGLGATLSVLARGRDASGQVIVVGGGSADPSSAPAASSPAASSPAAPAPAVEPAGPRVALEPSAALPPELAARSAKGAREPAPKGARSGRNPTAAPTSESGAGELQQRLARAVAQQSASFQDCFTVHLKEAGAAPAATLHFSVAKQGGAAQVNVEPPALAATPLGACLERAGRRVQFPALEKEVSFRVPVRARVTRGEPQ
jgi:tRNA A-37 threonylcarbamoyl transferase component Bud32